MTAPVSTRLKPQFWNLGDTGPFERSAASRPQTATMPAFGVPAMNEMLAWRAPASALGTSSWCAVRRFTIILVVVIEQRLRDIDNLGEMKQFELRYGRKGI